MPKLTEQLKRVKIAQPFLANLSLAQRNKILINLATLLKRNQSEILKANAKDLKNLKRSEVRDRLVLNETRILGMSSGLLKLSKLSDPLNKALEIKKPKNGLVIKKISVPLGVIGVIYESRPNVTIDLAGLAIKSGNGLVLKGGSESFESNKVLVKLIHQALKMSGLPGDLIYLINPIDDWQKPLLNAHGLIDVLIPRGSNNLIKWVRENSKLPVIETGAGVCHTFVDQGYDPENAAEIIFNAKTQRPDVCNALDALVIHRAALKIVLPILATKLIEFNNQRSSLRGASRQARGALSDSRMGAKMTFDMESEVEIFADLESYEVLKNIYPAELLKKTKPSHYGHEFLSQKMAIKTVKSFEEGLEFVKKYTSGHSEAILSNNKNHIEQFLNEIDAAAVYVNASTRFTDGEEFGMGAEVGISTQKLHARGPMGLEALTSYKWLVYGKGQVRP